jgi:hypothetical protein
VRKLAISAAVLLVASLAFADKKDDKQFSNLSFTVLRDSGKPLRNAAVVLHPVNKDGKQEHGGLELKTNADGKAEINNVPYGRLRIQIIAPGFRTYGEDHDINQPAHEFNIKMERPKDQYSIYDK